jgi:ppGpp synthetase/RelA/SpoT-type nucleotidyltranferase
VVRSMPKGLGKASVFAEPTEDEARALAHKASFASRWLEPKLRESLAAKGAYAFKHRVKAWGEIRRKAIRRRFGLDRINDAAGFRIVTLFQDEIPDVVNALIDLVRSTPVPDASAEGWFVDDGIAEVEIHSSRRADDPLSIGHRTRSIIDAKGLKDKLGDDQFSSYSSVHLILKVEFKEDGGSCYCPVEVQVRRVFEDAWAEISHRLIYGPEKRSDRATVGSTSERPAWRPHLDALKAVVDGCMQHADLINRAYLYESARETAPREAKQIVPTKLERFASAGRATQERVAEAVKIRNRAEQLGQSENQRTEFGKAALAFAEARQELSLQLPSQRALVESLDRELALEEAYCLLFSGNVENARRAELMYRELANEDPLDPVPAYRLGQIFHLAENFIEAREQYENALELLRKSELPEDHWLRASLPRHLGLMSWRLAERESDSAKKIALLEAAFDLTLEGLKLATPKEEKTFHNNIMYYSWELLTEAAGHPRKEEFERALQAHRDSLWAHLNVESERNRRWLDTLLRVERYLGHGDKALVLAGRILDLIREVLFPEADEQDVRQKVIRYQDIERLTADDRDIYIYAIDTVERSRPNGARATS